MTTNLKPGELLNEREAAAILHCSVQTLRNYRWARKGSGPRFHKVGPRMVRYSHADLVAFVENGASGPGVAA